MKSEFKQPNFFVNFHKLKRMSRVKATSELFESFTEYLIERYGEEGEASKLKTELS